MSISTCANEGQWGIFHSVQSLFYPITVSFYLYQSPVMNEAINGGSGQGVVVIEDFSPISEGSIGCDDNGATFIPAGDHLKEEFCALLVHG